jgi:NTE family protein
MTSCAPDVVVSNGHRPKIALALGSGGARGLSHIGVIKVLEQSGIPIDFIAGTSIGALIGGFYASGIAIGEIEKIMLKTDWPTVFSMIDPHIKQGLLRGEKVKAFIGSHVQGRMIENCRIPFVAVATDMGNGEPVTISEGDLALAIRASISIPLVFKPVMTGGRMLVDGALSAPVPAEIARRMGADIVIAVNLDHYYHDDEHCQPGWYDTANDSLGILRHHLSMYNAAVADVVFNVNVGKCYWYQFVDGLDKIQSGERAARENLPSLRAIMSSYSGTEGIMRRKQMP